jgi:glycosyltransferase involved in cell wall biosynthesis
VPYVCKFSIIIAVYNVEKYLAECLDSVINQTLRNIEIICVDDGSTDGSLKILEQYAKQDPRIQIIKQKNNGLSTARNNAMKIAKGEYFDFLDSDDYLKPDTLEVLYKYCKSGDLDMLSFSGNNFYDGSNVLESNGYWDFLYLPEPIGFKKLTFKDCLPFMHKMAVSSCLTVYKRAFVESINLIFPDGLFFEDNVFFYKSLTNAKNIGLLNEKLYCRRLHNASITQNRDKHVYDIIKITEILLDYLCSINLDKNVFSKISDGYCENVLRTYIQSDNKYRYYKYCRILFEKHDKTRLALIKKESYLTSYIFFPYYLLANVWMKRFYIPLLKFRNHTRAILYSHSHHGKIDTMNAQFNKIATTVQSGQANINKQIENLNKKYQELQMQNISQLQQITTVLNEISESLKNTKTKRTRKTK